MIELKNNKSEIIVDINKRGNMDVTGVKTELNNARSKLINNYLLTNFESKNLTLKLFINSIEEELIKKALKISGGNQKAASVILGMKATTLNEKIRKYNIKDSGKFKLQMELFHILQYHDRFELTSDQK